MDYKNYGDNRMKIVYGCYNGVQKYAVNELYKVIQKYLNYSLSAERADEYEALNDTKDNLVFIGTKASNKYIKEFIDKGLLTEETRKEGYSFKICQSPYNSERKIIIIQGSDDEGVLYGVRDFQHYYEQGILKYSGYIYNGQQIPFVEVLEDYEKTSYPKIEYRGLWTWGHVIYDYKGYIDNMSRWKMNTVVIWNDYAPVNAKEVVDYAHERGVKIIWGFSWCWGQEVNPNNNSELDYWTDFAIKTYEEQYKDLGGDGIYFQAFTETHETKINGESIAVLVEKWVNHISKRFFNEYPDLWIQFGVHASSIKDECNTFNSIDDRISIVWEDAGSFPYNYRPEVINNFDETYDYTAKLLNIRGKNERYGAVLKGFTVLNWLLFEHQKSKIILGEADKSFILKRAKDKEFYWKYAQGHWISQADKLKQFLNLVANSDIKDKVMLALVEDGMWEVNSYLPMVFLAEMMWNPNQDTNNLIKAISLCDDCIGI